MDIFIDSVVPRIVEEIKAHTKLDSGNLLIKRSKIDEIVIDVKSRLNLNDMKKIDAYLLNMEVINSVVEIATSNFETIIKDGKIDIDDAPHFLRMMNDIYVKVDKFNQQNVKISISSNDLVELTGLLIKIIIVCMVTSNSQVKKVVEFIDSAILITKFGMKKTSWSFPLKCKCN
jgi:hypothetical protein